MGILIKNAARRLILEPGENITLDDLLKNAGITEGEVIIIIPEGVIIGSTDGTPAIITGDLSDYDKVTLIIEGEVQGSGGIPNSGNGGTAIYATSPIEIIITETGAVRGGGGAGRVGITGASSTTTTWGAEQYAPNHSDNTGTYWRNPTRVRSDELVINGTIYLGVGIVSSYGNYRRGSHRLTSTSTWGNGNEDKWYAIQQKTTTTIAGSPGGSGGYGQGYQQAPTDGLPSSGNGGTGGDGGTWGTAGGWSDSGGEAGYAILTNNGPATGVTVDNSGVINGPTYY